MNAVSAASPPLRSLVIGAGGMLGRDLCDELSRRGHTVIAAGRRPGLLPLDITASPAEVQDIIAAQKPDSVYLAAAWTDVDGAERNPAAAFRVNADGTGKVAAAVAETGAWLVYVSTDFVFDGAKPGGEPYSEDDAVGPLNAYGASKEAGEQQVRQALPDRHMIARTSWLFGPHGKNFVKTVQRLAAVLPEVPIVADQIGCPTHTADLARVLVSLAENPVSGTYHVCNSGRCSWYEFARAIAAQSGLATPIVPITASEYAARFHSPTRRPACSVMRRFALEKRGMDDLPPWETALAAYLEGEG